jgi:hypothetical protein
MTRELGWDRFQFRVRKDEGEHAGGIRGRRLKVCGRASVIAAVGRREVRHFHPPAVKYYM